ncbi:FAD:protein FMN transferase [Glaciecola petra]|uniref:FAD:protein FMN transferase n=1 Tax=Glaciecola petra TaxID=3075602 RepID=A0ABU2ZV77_9ALTE|nr:FAD:protein FMN transferase [Aestuariibacter sp. P117]MDT0596552.1 FAD:protein FMN transferase [Aestuariibacter sp. P117]
MKHLYLCFLAASVLLLSSCDNADKTAKLVTLNGLTMGTTYEVKYVEPVGSQAQFGSMQLHSKIDELLININQLMSTYIADSELSLLNQAPADITFPISEQTNYVIQEAQKLNVLSEGMLDITVGPLVNLWGFGPSAKPEKVPTSEQLSKVSQFVGIDKFRLENRGVTKSHENVYIDLSTIAKGYGVDAIAELLESFGINNYLVEIGGELRVSGYKSVGQDWLIAIEKPISDKRAVQRIISIGDGALASSGDYRRYYEEDGIRYSHLIDPKTGYPIQHKLVAVTVVSDKSIHADGLATALIVMGKEKGMELANKEGIAALFITKEMNEFVEYQSEVYASRVKTIQ